MLRLDRDVHRLDLEHAGQHGDRVVARSLRHARRDRVFADCRRRRRAVGRKSHLYVAGREQAALRHVVLVPEELELFPVELLLRLRTNRDLSRCDLKESIDVFNRTERGKFKPLNVGKRNPVRADRSGSRIHRHTLRIGDGDCDARHVLGLVRPFYESDELQIVGNGKLRSVHLVRDYRLDAQRRRGSPDCRDELVRVVLLVVVARGRHNFGEVSIDANIWKRAGDSQHDIAAGHKTIANSPLKEILSVRNAPCRINHHAVACNADRTRIYTARYIMRHLDTISRRRTNV